MNAELEAKLYEAYPDMLANRHKSPGETCMCWGIECGDGWYRLLNNLMSLIKNHQEWQNRCREQVIKHNAIALDCRVGDFRSFEAEFGETLKGEWLEKRREQFVTEPLKPVPEEVNWVVLDQIKEKFGGLRFYYSGGDDMVDGMVRMAEAMSCTICEQCGNQGFVRGSGWIKTLCDRHHEEREQKRAQW